MWRYRKPSFELLLLRELQKQQRSSSLCDTILQADGISVPAHSCVLSAISPQFSRTLSAAPPLSLGQSHLLEFQAVRAHTLLKLVGFLYSGELEGSGDHEREEVIAAAWKLGIEGLEEVGRKEEGMQEKYSTGVTEDEKDCEDDDGEVKELGRRQEESEGLIEQTDGMRGSGMVKDKGMQTEFSKDRQGVCWMTGVGDSGGEDQDMNTERSFATLPKKASDSETQTEVSEMTVGSADMETQTHEPVLRDKETDTSTQRNIPVLMDRERETGTQIDVPIWMDRERDTGTQTDISVWADRETDTGTQTDVPVWADRETDTGTQTDVPVCMGGGTDTDTQTDTPVLMDRGTDTGTQTDLPVWRKRWTEADGNNSICPLPPMSVCSTASSEWSWADHQSTRFSIPLLPSIKPMAFCTASLPLQLSSVSGGPPCNRDNSGALLSAGDLQGEGGAQLAIAGHVTHRHETGFVTVREGDHTPTLAGHTIGDSPLVNISIEKSSSGPALAVTNLPSSTIFPVSPFTANITAETAETDVNSPTPSVSAPAVTPASALSAHHSDTGPSARLIIAHHIGNIAPTSEILISDRNDIAPAPAANAVDSASLVATAGASSGPDVGLLSVSESACSFSSAADLSAIAPVAEVMAQPCMALPTNPSIPLPHTSLPPPSGDFCSPPCIILTGPQGADLEDHGGGAIQPSTSPVCILSQGLCDCPLIPAASPTPAQVEELRPPQSSSFPPVQAELDFQGAVVTAEKNISGHFGSGGGQVVGDGVQGLGAEENGGFERFEGNIVGFINYFLNPKPSQEESFHAGVGKSNVTGLQNMAPSTLRKRGRPRKTGISRTEVVTAEGERGNPSSLGRGCGRERMELRSRSPQKGVGIVARRGQGRGRGGGGGGASVRDRQQPIKMKLKKQPEGGVWEIVDVRAEAFRAPRRRRGRPCKAAIGGQEHTQDTFPIIKRQRGQPRVHPFRISSLPSQVFNALVSLPDLAQLSMSQAPFLSGCGWHPRQDQLRAVPPPPPLQAAPEESAQQFEKLLDDMVGLVMGLDANGEGVCTNDSGAGGTASLLQPHPALSVGPHIMDMVSPGSCLLPEVVISSSPCNVTPAMASEGDFAVTANPVPLQSVTTSPVASVPYTKTHVPLREPRHGTTTAPSHGCCSSSLYSICPHPHEEAAPCRRHSASSANPVSLCSEFGKESIVVPKDSLLSRSSRGAGVTISGSAYGLLQTAAADSETPVRCSAVVQPNLRSSSGTERARSPVLSCSSEVSTDHSSATDTSLYSSSQETTAAVNDILEHILLSSGNESELQCVNDGARPGGIVWEDGAEVQKEATTPDVLGQHLSKDTRDVNGSEGTDGPLECSEGSQTETQHLQEHGTLLRNILSPVQTELTLDPERPIKTSQDTSHIPVESQISSSAIHSKQQSSKDLSCCPSPDPEGLWIPSLMTEHLPANSSPKRLQSPVTKQPVPTDCSKRPTGVRGDKGPLGNRLGGREKVDVEYKKRKIVTRSQTKKSRTKETEDGEGQTSSNQRKQSVKRGLHSQMPMWERHADGRVIKRLRRSASWCEEENIGRLRDDTFRSAERRRWEGQTTGVTLRKVSTSVYHWMNMSACSGKKPGNFAGKREVRYSAARVCISCTEKSPLDKLEQLDSYMNRLTKAKGLANKPMRTEYGTRDLTKARNHKAVGVSKGGPSKRDTSEKMCKPSLITQELKIPRGARGEAGSTLAKSTVNCWKAKRCQVVSECKKMGDSQTDQGKLHTTGRKRRMQDAMELKTRQGPPDKRKDAKLMCTVCPQQRHGNLPQHPSLDLLQGRVKQRPKEQNPVLRDGKACTMRADSWPLNSSGVHNFRELLQHKRRVMKSREERVENEKQEDCRDGGATSDEWNCVNGEVVTVQDGKGHGQTLESRAANTGDGETTNKEIPTEHDCACSTDGEVGETGPSEMDGVDKPAADGPKRECENSQGMTSPSETEKQDMSKGNSIMSGVAMSSQMPHNVTGAAAGSLESEGEVDVEVDVLECSSPICVSLDTLYWSAAQGSNDAAPFEVDAGEEDEEVDVTGEESE